MVQENAEAEGQSPDVLQSSTNILVQGQKSWTIPEGPAPYCICLLNEWCQAFSPPNTAKLHWEFSGDASDVSRGGEADTADREDPPSSAAPVDHKASVDHKGLLGHLLQRLLRRPVGTGEVIYHTTGAAPSFTATALVTPAVSGGDGSSQRFTGQEMPTKKQAEQSAAEVAINGLKDIMPLTCAPAQQPVNCETRADLPSVAAPIDHKGLLAQHVQKILRRPVAAGEVIYDVIGEGSCFTATVLVTPSIHGGDGSSYRPRRFTGQEMATRKQAEQSAAEVAIDGLRDIGPLPIAPAQQSANSKSDVPAKVSSQSTCSDSENHKGSLLNVLQKHLGRPLVLGDVVWTHTEEEGRFVATVEVSAVVLELGRVSGTSCSSKKAAQQSAAKVTLEQIRSTTKTDLLASSPQTADQAAISPPRAELVSAPSTPNTINCKNLLKFTCKGWITCGDSVLVKSASESCSNKQAAKEDAAWRLCIALHNARSSSSDNHLGAEAERENKGAKKPGTLTKREKLALGPTWHGELREVCPAAGQHCAKLRLKLGWSQKDLAARLNQPLDVVQQLEADGLLPSGAVINSLNRLLGEPLPRATHVRGAPGTLAHETGVKPERPVQLQPKDPILEDFLPPDWEQKLDDCGN